MLSLLFAPGVRAQLPATAGQGWYTGNVYIPLPNQFRMLATVELNDGTNYEYQQWIVGAGVGFRWKRIGELAHLVNINPDKESRVVVGAGYEYLWTNTDGNETGEDRLILGVTPRYRPLGRWLIEDRNRFEFRWVDGRYSTRYRNRLQFEFDVKSHDFRFTPYVAGEIFYSFSSGTVNEQQYAVGIQWPWRRLFMIDTYYLYQHTTSAPTSTNVFGVQFSLYLRNAL